MIWAVHLSDSVLENVWWIVGWPVAAALVAWSSRRLHDDELARLGVLTAAFFVASQVHLPLGGVSVHLLLNGLIGVILARRAALAISVGLFLQAALFAHGGWSTLGINICIYTLPAVTAGLLFPKLVHSSWLQSPSLRRLLVAILLLLWFSLALIACQWTLGKIWPTQFLWSPLASEWWLANPYVGASLLIGSISLAFLEPRVERSPVFPLGLFLGAATGFGTVGLNALILLLGSKPEFEALPGLVVLLHLPIIVLESLAIGFIVVYLSKAKPEWLQSQRVDRPTVS